MKEVANCPVCGEQYQEPKEGICNWPNMLFIPPGQHIHHTCPVRGEVVLYGNNVRY